MTNAKHTPLPWRIEINPRFDEIEVHSDRGVSLADVNDVNGLTFAPERPEALANARLIAAAPDLLKALKEAVSQHGHGLVNLDAARAAIAKAKGEDK